MKRFLKILILSVLLGFFLLLISASATREPWGASDGYPFHYSYPNSPCKVVNPFNGCGYSYDPVLVGLDFLFWLAIATVAVSAIDLTWNQISFALGRASNNLPSRSSQNVKKRAQQGVLLRIPKLRLLRGRWLGPSDCESYLNVLRGDDLHVVSAILRKLEALACSVLGDHSEGTLVDCYSELV